METVSANLGTSEGDYFSIFGEDERLSRMLVIQRSSGLEDLQILIANVLDCGDDPYFGRGRDLVGGSREGNLKTTSSANRGLRISADGRKTESEERQGEHGEAEKSKGSSNWIGARCASASQHPILLYLFERERFSHRSADIPERKYWPVRSRRWKPRMLSDLGYRSFSKDGE